MYFKSILIYIVILLFSIFHIFSQSTLIGFFHSVTPESSTCLVYDIDGNARQSLTGDFIEINETITTQDNQDAQIIIYDGENAVASIILSSNSDLRFSKDSGILSVHIVHGLLRIVTKEKVLLNINGQNFNISAGSDLGIETLFDNDTNYFQKFYIFKGETTLPDTESIIKQWEMLHIAENLDENVTKNYEEDQFLFWKNNYTVDITDFEESLPFTLEKLVYDDKYKKLEVTKKKVRTVKRVYANSNSGVDEDTTEIDEELSEIDEVSTEPVIKEEKEEIIKRVKLTKQEIAKIIMSLFAHNVGIFMDGNDYVGFVNLKPHLDLFGSNLKFGFNLPFMVIPSQFLEGNGFYNVNEFNDQWSFGSDQEEITERIVYDVFDDLMLKVSFFELFNEYNWLHIIGGDIYDLNDPLYYNFFHYHPYQYHLVSQNASVKLKLEFPFIESQIYAEDIMPKGLYYADVNLRNPSKSFKFRFGTSIAVDMKDFYNTLMSDDDNEVFSPFDLSTQLHFTAFDLPSFGFEIFIAGGFSIPFSFTMDNSSSLFDTLMNTNQSWFTYMMNFQSGMHFSYKKFIFAWELIVDSPINRIGKYDFIRSSRNIELDNIMTNYLTRYINNYGFLSNYSLGVRLRVGYELYDWVKFLINYRVSFSYNTDYEIPFELFDKLMISLNLDSQKRWKKRVGFKLIYGLEKMVFSIKELVNQNYSVFFYNQLASMNFYFYPVSSLSINAGAGILPDYNSDIFYKFHVELFLSFKPDISDFTKKDEKTKMNL